MADEVYIDPTEMFQELKNRLSRAVPKRRTAPENAARQDWTIRRSDSDKGKLIRLFLWHRSEDDPRMRIKSLNAQEAFGVYVKASLLVGILLASPWIFYQIWHFVAAGLYPRTLLRAHLSAVQSRSVPHGSGAGLLRGF